MQSIFTNASIYLFHFLTKYNAFQQMFTQFKNFIIYMILVVVESKTNYFKFNLQIDLNIKKN